MCDVIGCAGSEMLKVSYVDSSAWVCEGCFTKQASGKTLRFEA